MSDNTRFYVGHPDDLEGLTRSEVEDMTFEYYWQAEEHVEEYLNEILDIGHGSYGAGEVMRKCDPIAFRCTMSDMTAEIDLTDYPED